VERAKSEIGLESMAHLTCVGHSKQEIKSILDELTKSGIENVIALRGDPPPGEASFKPHPDGFKHASELTRFIRSAYSFCIAVAGYPEGHSESPSKEEDWNHLQEKVNAGGDFIITQLFFDNRDFFTFEKRMREKGVTVPIIPGIMPITNYSQILRFSRVCGANIPETVVEDLEAIQHDHDAVQQYGITFATRQCRELVAHGVPGIHFYTLNKSKSSQRIYENLQSHVIDDSPT
jgi:methylenetetrahydrofolate reductase (NADPH)